MSNETTVSYSTDGCNVIMQVKSGDSHHFLKTDRVIEIIRILSENDLKELGINPDNLTEKYMLCRDDNPKGKNLAVYNIFSKNDYNLAFGDVVEFKVLKTLNEETMYQKLNKFL